MDAVKQRLLDAALPHVTFDGWTAGTFTTACRDAGVDIGVAQGVCPRGALDLAVAYHQAGDTAMRQAMATRDMSSMKIRGRVALAIRTRLDVSDKEIVRRGLVLFALPQNMVQGTQLIWGSADAVWEALGDASRDGNWYSKRAILSAVYSSVVLYWLGDESDGQAATWEFLDRRIEDVMRIEQSKGQLRANPLTKGLMAGVDAVFSRVQAPKPRDDLPGHWDGRV